MQPFANLDQLIQYLIHNPERLIVGVAGASGSGKTYYAKLLAINTQSLYIAMDDYYLPRNIQIKDDSGQYIYDLPESFEIPLLIDHLTQLVQGYSVEKPIYNYHKSRYGRLEETERIQTARHIILDGLYAFYGELEDRVDIKIFIHRNANDRLKSRIIRDVKERNTPPEWSEKTFYQYAEPYFRKYGIQQQEDADCVIDNNGFKNE